jgi:hypothetical protein
MDPTFQQHYAPDSNPTLHHQSHNAFSHNNFQTSNFAPAFKQIPSHPAFNLATIQQPTGSIRAFPSFSKIARAVDPEQTIRNNAQSSWLTGTATPTPNIPHNKTSGDATSGSGEQLNPTPTHQTSNINAPKRHTPTLGAHPPTLPDPKPMP